MATKLLLATFATLLAVASASGTPPARFPQSTKPDYLNGAEEKIIHIRFFLHDLSTGPNASLVAVAQGPNTNTSPTQFGMVHVIDDPLTVGPEISSGLVGRAQGLYALASQETVVPCIAMTFVFVEGAYNGSTLVVLGRNQLSLKVRELPIIGGTGLFRFARGYILTRTQSFNNTLGNAVLEYNCYVLRY